VTSMRGKVDLLTACHLYNLAQVVGPHSAAGHDFDSAGCAFDEFLDECGALQGTLLLTARQQACNSQADDCFKCLEWVGSDIERPVKNGRESVSSLYQSGCSSAIDSSICG